MEKLVKEKIRIKLESQLTAGWYKCQSLLIWQIHIIEKAFMQINQRSNFECKLWKNKKYYVFQILVCHGGSVQVCF